ncbi:hypothetical protein TKK_0015985 [Trichogramma kaykai]|uniref:Coiled-coil domain-containing protein 86 n=1 Tax=Trichogramma kaykai TaxID=54128 RepID=A0ABD2W930_9HYME
MSASQVTSVKGKPKSGRVWKSSKQRFSSIKKTPAIHVSFEKRQRLKEERKKCMELSNEIKQQKAAEKEAKKERRRENIRRTQENERKAEVVQVISNPAKIKRMKKKQLRNIVKRDTTKVEK